MQGVSNANRWNQATYIVHRISVKPLGHLALLDTFPMLRCLENFSPSKSVPPQEEPKLGFSSFPWTEYRLKVLPTRCTWSGFSQKAGDARKQESGVHSGRGRGIGIQHSEAAMAELLEETYHVQYCRWDLCFLCQYGCWQGPYGSSLEGGIIFPFRTFQRSWQVAVSFNKHAFHLNQQGRVLLFATKNLDCYNR